MAAATTVGLAGGVASAQSDGAVPRLIFPIVGSVAFSNDWGDARWQGSHQGTDIMAPRRTIAVAAEAGKVKYWTSSSSAGCMLYLYGKSGTTYLYIHLNNDVTKGNDNRGQCVAGMAYAKGLKRRRDAWRPESQSGSSATRATPMAPIRTFTSRCTRTTEAR